MEVAPLLLGWTLSHGGVTVRIVETEAYLAADDAASHARGGPRGRSRTMFGQVGRAYIYRIYGVHLCFNVVCHAPETGGAVLVRAGTVLEGRDLARSRRGSSQGLADGPGKLAQCLALTPELDGTSLLDGPITLRRTQQLEKDSITRGTRVGISRDVQKPYRFWLTGCPDLSRRSP